MLGEFVPGMNILINAEVTGAIREITKLNGSLEKTKLTVGSVSGVIGKFSGLAIGAFAAMAFGADRMANKMEVANTQLAASFTALGYDAKQLMPIAEQTEQVFTNLGFTVGDTAEALKTLTTGLGSPTSAMQFMTVAADFARKANMSLAESAMAIVKATQGQTRAFKTVGVSFDEGTTAAEKFTKGMDKVAKATAGSAVAFAKSAEGGMAIMAAKTQAATAVLGQALQPILVWMAAFITAVVVPALKSLANAFTNMQTPVKIIISLFTGLFIASKIVGGILLIGRAIEALSAAMVVLKSTTMGAYLAEAGLLSLTGVGIAVVAASAATAAAAYYGLNKIIDSSKEKMGDANSVFKDFDKLTADMLLKAGKGTINFPGAAGAGAGGKKLASDIENVFSQLSKSVSDMIKNMSKITSFDLASKIKNSFTDPLTAAYNNLTKASSTYSAEQKKFTNATIESTKASLAHAKALDALNNATDKNVDALTTAADVAKNTAKIAGDAAMAQAEATNQALQDIISAQEDYANAVLARVQNFRDAFANATKIDLGGMAGNIAQAKQQVADAETALKAAQDKFASTATLASYSGVATAVSLPMFTAEEAAVAKAKKDLQVALGKESNPFAATAQELLTALENQYTKATDLSKNAGLLASAGFSQEFITQVLDSGTDMGNALSNAILSSDKTTQASWQKVYSNLDTISKTGVNTLATTMNQGSIDIMNQFISGFKAQEDPLKKALQSINDMVTAMAGSIAAAIASMNAQIAAMTGAQVSSSVPPTGSSYGAFSELPTSVVNNSNVEVHVTQPNATASDIAGALAFTTKTSSDIIYNLPKVDNSTVTARPSSQYGVTRTSILSGGSQRGD
jgi:hypothetical protein